MKLSLTRFEILIGVFVLAAVLVPLVLSIFPGARSFSEDLILIPRPQVTNEGQVERREALDSLTPGAEPTTEDVSAITEDLSAPEHPSVPVTEAPPSVLDSLSAH